MRRKSLAIFCVLFLSVSPTVIAQQLNPGIVWQKCLGGSGDDKANSLVSTVDGGFIIAGSSTSNNGDVSGHHGFPDSTDAWIVKISATGTVQWQRSVGGSGKDVFNSVIPLADGNFICMGTTSSHDGDVSGNRGSSDLWVVKISAHGVLLWSKCYGGSSMETAGNIKENQDGSLYMIGTTTSGDGDVTGSRGDQDIWVLKLNSDGSINWERCFGGASQDQGFDISESDNGSFIVGITSESTDGDFGNIGGQSPRGAVIKIASDYSMIWKVAANASKPIALMPAGNTYDVNTDVLGCIPILNNSAATQYQFTDVPGSGTGPYMLTAVTSYSYCNADALVQQGYKTAGASGIARINDIDHLFAGSSDDSVTYSGFHGGFFDGFFSGYKVGTGIAWEKFLGGTGDDEFTSVRVIDPYNYIAAGFTNSNDGDVSGNHGGYDVWVVKMGRINTIRGTVYQDYNHNNVKDPGEPFVNSIVVQSQKGSSKSASSTYDGMFGNQVDTGSFTTTVFTPLPYYTVVPASKTSSFTSYNNSDSFSFALQPTPGIRDYAVNIWPSGLAIPGFSTNYLLNVSNKGTDTLINKRVSLMLDNRMAFISSAPTPSAVSGDTISWNIARLSPRDTIAFNIQVQLKSPPDLNYTDTLYLSALLDSSGDVYPADNTSFAYQRMTGSFDPNSKEEIHAGSMALQDVAAGRNLLYTIHFQNTGNDTAYNVVIRDTLDSKMTAASLTMIGASHPYTLTIQDSSILTWTFRNILLVDSMHNEPASHGYVSYLVKPQVSLNIGDEIRNTSSAYFDYNLPVQTNTELTIIKKNQPFLATPALSHLDTVFCSTVENQIVKILNNPPEAAGITVTVLLDGTQTLPVGPDSSFNITLNGLSSGHHSVKVSFTDQSGQSKSTLLSFTIRQSGMLTLSLSASNTVVGSGTDPVIITATGSGGGGQTPQFAFASDNRFEHVLQAQGSNNLLSIQPSTLFVGDNWIYARMTATDSCQHGSSVDDSINIKHSLTAGIIDPDFPGQAINAYPNPFALYFTVTGLHPGKQYEIMVYNDIGQQILDKGVSNQTTCEVNRTHFEKGYYTVRVYDRSKNRLLGIIKMLSQ